MVDKFLYDEIPSGVSIIVFLQSDAQSVKRFFNNYFNEQASYPVEFIIIDQTDNDGISDILCNFSKNVFIRLINSEKKLSFPELIRLVNIKARFEYQLYVNESIECIDKAFLLAKKVLSELDICGIGTLLDNNSNSNFRLQQPNIEWTGVKFENIDSDKVCNKITINDYCSSKIKYLKEGLIAEKITPFLLLKNNQTNCFSMVFDQFNWGFKDRLNDEIRGKNSVDNCINKIKKYKKAPKKNKQSLTIIAQNPVIAFDDAWQFPAITEKHAFLKACELLPYTEDSIYFGFPWATLIDGLNLQTEDGEQLKDKLYQFRSKLKNYSFVITVCQHIMMLKYQKLFSDLGVTHIFWSHAIKDQDVLPTNNRIRIYPFPLYPVQAPNNDLQVNKNKKKYLFSFIGAKSNEWYLTKSREMILDNLNRETDGVIIARGNWHYQQSVYNNQILKTPDDERNDLENRAAKEYKKVMKNSLFSLCPSGSGPNTIRLWESIGSGSIPVIISDTYLPPGNLTLWREATVSCEENLESILALPDRLAEMAKEEILIQRKKDALNQLWKKYGPACFIGDIIDLFQDLKSAKMAEKVREADQVANTSEIEKSLRTENELLLLQLHQVQEELEAYYFKYQDLKNSRPSANNYD